MGKVKVVDPLPFLDMIRLEQAAFCIVTDSGGVQKEAFFYEVPCVTMRDETEWTETVELGWNTLVGASRGRIVDAVRRPLRPSSTGSKPYGHGRAAIAISRELLSHR